MHVHPTVGRPRDVAGKVLDMLFPADAPARIPVVAITGTNGKTTTSRMLAHILKMSGYKVGLTTTDGLYINGKRILEGDLTGPWSARMVLRDPTVDFAVLETAGADRKRVPSPHPPSETTAASTTGAAKMRRGRPNRLSPDCLPTLTSVPFVLVRSPTIMV